MEFALFWFLFAIAVGVLAGNRGRSGFLWFLLSVFISPLLGLVFCLVSKDLRAAAPGVAGVAQPTSYTHVKCPKCAELVLPEAVVCKHCGAALVPDPGYALRQAYERKMQGAENSRQGMIGVAIIVGLFILGVVVFKAMAR